MSNRHITGRSEQIVARVPHDLAIALRMQAEQRGLTVSAAVIAAIEAWLQRPPEARTLTYHPLPDDDGSVQF